MCGQGNGGFAFNFGAGYAHVDISFRVVLYTMFCFGDLFILLGLFIEFIPG